MGCPRSRGRRRYQGIYQATASYPENDTHILFPNHDNLQSDESRPWAEYPAEPHLPLDGQGQSKDHAHEDSGIDTIEPEPPTAAFSA